MIERAAKKLSKQRTKETLLNFISHLTTENLTDLYTLVPSNHIQEAIDALATNIIDTNNFDGLTLILDDPRLLTPFGHGILIGLMYAHAIGFGRKEELELDGRANYYWLMYSRVNEADAQDFFLTLQFFNQDIFIDENNNLVMPIKKGLPALPETETEEF